MIKALEREALKKPEALSTFLKIDSEFSGKCHNVQMSIQNLKLLSITYFCTVVSSKFWFGKKNPI